MRFRYSRQAHRTALKWVFTALAPFTAFYYAKILVGVGDLAWSRQPHTERLETVAVLLGFGAIGLSPAYVALYLWWPALLALFRRRRGLCGSCGYDRRGLAADAKCPECRTVPALPSK
jgi:hypothetical protein